jgi:flagellar basal-body rod modification protein FlgD
MTVTPTTNNPATPAPATPSSTLTGDSFMTLLVAQLKAQDPTSPMDPTQFVGQLVQFNSLQQLINIRQDMDTATKPLTTTPTTPLP